MHVLRRAHLSLLCLRVDQPEPLELLFGVPDVPILTSLAALPFLVRFGLDHEHAQPASIRRPVQEIQLALLVEGADRFAAVSWHHVDAALAPLGPVREEGQALAVGRPAWTAVMPHAAREWPRSFAGRRSDPDCCFPVLATAADRPSHKGDQRAIGREVWLRRPVMRHTLLDGHPGRGSLCRCFAHAPLPFHPACFATESIDRQR